MRFFIALFSAALISHSALAQEVAATEAAPVAVEVPVAETASKVLIKKATPQKRTDVLVTATSYPTLVQSRPAIGYLNITNALKEDITLYGVVATDVSGKVEIHTHKSKDGIMKMVQLKELKVPANSTLNFQDTKLHLMMMDMKKELVAGDSYPMTLKFQREEGSLLPIEVEVSVVER